MVCKYCKADCKTRPQLNPGESWSASTAKKYAWFSKAHKTAAAHIAAQNAKTDRVEAFFSTIEKNAKSRANRTPREQLDRLDKMLGKDKGAKKERMRLLAKIAGDKPKRKK